MRSGRPPGGPSTSTSSAQQHRGLRAPPLSLCQLGRPTPVDRPTPPAPPHQPLRPAIPPPASREAVYDGVRLCLTSMQAVQRRAQSLHRRLHGALQHLDGLDLATREDLREADRLRKVLAAAISFAVPSPYIGTAAMGGRPQPEGGRGAGYGQHPLEHPVLDTSQLRRTPDPLETTAKNSGNNSVSSSTSTAAASYGDGGGVEPEGGLMPLLHRVDAARAQLAAIGSRHEGGAYGPLRRYYFGADEPLTVLAVRSREYCRVLARAAEEGTAAEGQKGEEEVEWPHAAQQLLEEATLALSSRTMQAFLALDEDALGQLAEQAAADAGALAELRHELTLVVAEAEGRGLPLQQLLRLADAG